MLFLNSKKAAEVLSEVFAEPDDYELIQQVLDGRRQEFRILIEKHQTLIYKMVFRMTRDAEISKELVQEVFLKSFEKLHTFRGESKFSTWLTRIALHITSNYLSSRAYRNKLNTLSTFPELPEEEQDHSKERSLLLLQQLISELKPLYRDPLVLSIYEEKSYEEIAEILEIPLGTVRSRLATGRESLKALFQESCGDD
jgi:RNA polymerase sigma factor (sigma-70 family)